MGQVESCWNTDTEVIFLVSILLKHMRCYLMDISFFSWGIKRPEGEACHSPVSKSA
jgi:hypothetical protein